MGFVVVNDEPMDLELRRKFVQHVLASLDANELPLVALETYLRGNTDDTSLGRGMRGPEGLQAYATVLRQVRARPDVDEVFVEVHEVPDPDEPEDDGMWASAFVVHVVTSATPDEIGRDVSSLNPRWVGQGWHARDDVVVPELPPTRHVVRIDLG